MIASHIHDALEQVGKLREIILEKKKFRGYSGVAKIFGGFIAFIGAYILSFSPEANNLYHLSAWGIVLLISLFVNYGALFYWFLFHPRDRKELLKILPAMDAIPSLIVGAIMSVSFIMHGYFNLLFGMWMCLYGITHIMYRLSLPKLIYCIGVFYILCGGYFLLDKTVSFTNPWIMGIVFLVGEVIGGYILLKHKESK